MDRDIYLHVSSGDSDKYFPLNNAANFCVKLNTPLNLNGSWVIGVCEVNIKNVNVSSNVKKGFSSFAIECNICTGLVVNGMHTRVLRIIPLEANISEKYPIIFYNPVETRFIDTLQFRLTNGGREEVDFALEESGGSHVDVGFVSMTLHLKRLY
jgi:hypothetical protein